MQSNIAQHGFQGFQQKLKHRVTGSIGLLSNAAESCVNLVAAIVAIWAVTFAAKPPDEDHKFGQYKAEYFAGGVEGALILTSV